MAGENRLRKIDVDARDHHRSGLRYSPDEIHFYLIDFKKGVEFKTYADHKLPHARVIAIESDREFGASVLGRLDAILSERGELFREVGAQDIKSFRAARPDVPMPRILLLVDEFQEFFTEDDKYSQIASQLIDRLVRQGRAFGMHVLLGSQSLGGAYALPRTTIGQMAVRIALQCSESDAHQILSESNGAARLLTRPGEAIYNNANGLLEGNSPFQVAWLDDKQRDGFLDQLEVMYDKLPNHWPEPVVFEGNIPADPAVNEPLVKLIAASAEGPPPETKPRAWLGDAVAIAGPVEIRFFRRSGTNLLLVGQDEEGALGILGTCIPTLAAQDVGRIDLFSDFNNPANEERWSPVLNAVKHHVRRSGPEEAAAVLADYAAELARRQETPGEYRSWFLIIDDVSRFRDLRKSDDDFGFGGMDRNKTQSPSQMFTSLLKEGPAVGLHLLVWVDSYNNVDRWFSRQMLREFEMRAVFQMSANDSSNLIDSPAASRLGNNRALLYSDERGTAEKFRPYQPPTAEWLATFQPRALPEPPPTPPASIAETSQGSDGGNGSSSQTSAAVDDLSGWNVK
ncbi:MAG: FtsK/SpoIIIE domain-containing protein [Planctomycetaceae bacterium]